MQGAQKEEGGAERGCRGVGVQGEGVQGCNAAGVQRRVVRCRGAM